MAEAGEVTMAHQPHLVLLAELLEVLALLEKRVHPWTEPAPSLCTMAGVGRHEVIFLWSP